MYTADIGIILGSSQIGLTLKAILVDSDGVDVGVEITTGFVEIGLGNYLWHYESFPDGHRGGVKFYVGTLPSGLKAFLSINPQEVENTDIKSSAISTSVLAGIGDAAVTIVSPVVSVSLIEIVQGDDYFEEDSRALSFSFENAPDLTGAVVLFTARRRTDTANTIEADCEVVTPTGSPKVIRFELESADTELLTVGNEEYLFDIQATLTNTHVVTLARGFMTVLSQMTTP